MDELDSSLPVDGISPEVRNFEVAEEVSPQQEKVNAAEARIRQLGMQLVEQEPAEVPDREISARSLSNDVTRLRGNLDSLVKEANFINAYRSSGKAECRGAVGLELKVLTAMQGQLRALASDLEADGIEGTTSEVLSLRREVAELEQKVDVASQELRHLRSFDQWSSANASAQIKLNDHTERLSTDIMYEDSALSATLSSVSLTPLLDAALDDASGVASLSQMRRELYGKIEDSRAGLQKHVKAVQGHYTLEINEIQAHLEKDRQNASEGSTEAFGRLALGTMQAEAYLEELKALESELDEAIDDISDAIIRLNDADPKAMQGLIESLEELQETLETSKAKIATLCAKAEKMVESQKALNADLASTIVKTDSSPLLASIAKRIDSLEQSTTLGDSGQIELEKLVAELRLLQTEETSSPTIRSLQSRLDSVRRSFPISVDQALCTREALRLDYLGNKEALTAEAQQRAKKLATHRLLDGIEERLDRDLLALNTQWEELTDLKTDYSSEALNNVAQHVRTLAELGLEARNFKSPALRKATEERIQANLNHIAFAIDSFSEELVSSLNAELAECSAQIKAAPDIWKRRKWEERREILVDICDSLEALCIEQEKAITEQYREYDKGNQPTSFFGRLFEAILPAEKTPHQKVGASVNAFSAELSSLRTQLRDVSSASGVSAKREKHRTPNHDLQEHPSASVRATSPALSKEVHARERAKEEFDASMLGWSENKKQFAWIAISLLYMGSYGYKAYNLSGDVAKLKSDADEASKRIRDSASSKTLRSTSFIATTLSDKLDHLRRMDDASFMKYTKRFPDTRATLAEVRASAGPLSTAEVRDIPNRFLMRQAAIEGQSGTIGDWLSDFFDEQDHSQPVTTSPVPVAKRAMPGQVIVTSPFIRLGQDPNSGGWRAELYSLVSGIQTAHRTSDGALGGVSVSLDELAEMPRSGTTTLLAKAVMEDDTDKALALMDRAGISTIDLPESGRVSMIDLLPEDADPRLISQLITRGVLPRTLDGVRAVIRHVEATFSVETLSTLIRNGMDPTLAMAGGGQAPLDLILASPTAAKQLDRLGLAGEQLEGALTPDRLGLLVANGNQEQLEALFPHGLDDLNTTTASGTPLLEAAVDEGNEETAAWLIAQGADPLVADADGSPLLLRCLSGDSTQNRQVIEKVLNTGIDPLERHPKSGRSVLDVVMQTGDIATVELLLESTTLGGKDLSPALSPLHELASLPCTASESALSEMGMALVKGACPLDLPAPISGETALFKACAHGHHALAKALVKSGANPKQKSRQQQTLLHAVAMGPEAASGNVEAILALGIDLDAKDSQGRTALHVAIQQGNVTVAKELIRLGADIETRTNSGETLLHLLAQTPMDTMDEASWELGKRALETFGGLSATDDSGNNALHLIATGSNIGLLKRIIANSDDAKAALSAPNNAGAIPLQLARSRGHSDVADVLQLATPKAPLPVSKDARSKEELSLVQALTQPLMEDLDSSIAEGATDPMTHLATSLIPSRRDAPQKILALKLLAHTWELGGTVPVGNSELPLEGGVQNQWVPHLKATVKDTCERHSELITSEQAGVLTSMLDNHLQLFWNIDRIDGETGPLDYIYGLSVAKGIRAGKPGIVFGGWHGHATQFAFHRGYLLYCNRGVGSKKPIEAFKIDPSKVSASILARFEVDSSKDFEKKFPGLLEELGAEQDDVSKALEKWNPLRPYQEVGNCSYESSETAEYGVLALDRLLEIGADDDSAQLASTEAYETSQVLMQESRLKALEQTLDIFERSPDQTTYTLAQGMMETLFDMDLAEVDYTAKPEQAVHELFRQLHTCRYTMSKTDRAAKACLAKGFGLTPQWRQHMEKRYSALRERYNNMSVGGASLAPALSAIVAVDS